MFGIGVAICIIIAGSILALVVMRKIKSGGWLPLMETIGIVLFGIGWLIQNLMKYLALAEGHRQIVSTVGVLLAVIGILIFAIAVISINIQHYNQPQSQEENSSPSPSEMDELEENGRDSGVLTGEHSVRR